MSLYSDPVKRRFQELGKLLYRNYENTTFVYFSFTIIRYSYAKNRSPGRPSLKKNMLPGGGGGVCPNRHERYSTFLWASLTCLFRQYFHDPVLYMYVLSPKKKLKNNSRDLYLMLFILERY